jgi:hypothetical protein
VIKALYISRGLALPSTTGPWSEDELLRMLARIDPEGLSVGERRLYDFAAAELNRSHNSLRLGGAVNAEVYGHTNTEDFVRADDYIRPFDRIKPFFDLTLEAWINTWFWGFTDLSIGNMVYDDQVQVDGGLYLSSTKFGASAFGHNLFAVPPNAFDDLEGTFPYRAVVSAGGAGWYAAIGRDRLSWGPGESGNFLVGDQVDYHNNFRAAFYNDTVKYTFNVSSFPYPGDYYDEGTQTLPENDPHWKSPSVDNYEKPQHALVEGINLFIAHRLEWRTLGDRLNLVLTEALMWQSETGFVDPTAFLPSMLLHNMFTPLNANSMLALEADWTIIPSLNLYAQIAMDELSFPGFEDAQGAADNTESNKMAYMLGIKTAFPAFRGLVGASLEAAYTDPFLYLRGADPRGTRTAGTDIVSRHVENLMPLNWVVANRYFYAGDGSYAENYLGYRWGGDAIVLNLKGEYREPGAWNLGLNVMFMIHGTIDKWTKWTQLDNDDGVRDNDPGLEHTPTSNGGDVKYSNYADSDTSDRTTPYYLTALSLSGSVNIGGVCGLPVLSGLSVYGQADFVYVVNKNNRPGYDAFDAQFTAGVSWKF